MAVQATAPTAAAYAPAEVDERPAQSGAAPDNTPQAGWEAAEALPVPAGDYPDEFKLTEQFKLVKFIEDPNIRGPLASYNQHFLKEGMKQGKRSYICLGENCPLCNILKDRPEQKRVFTVVEITGGVAKRGMLIATVKLYKKLHAAEFSPQGPLPKHFWQLSRIGAKQTTDYLTTPVKGRDLQEDHGIDEEAITAEIAKFEPFTKDDIPKANTYEELMEVVDEVQKK